MCNDEELIKTAKKYLKSIDALDRLIDAKQRQLDDLRRQLTSISTLNYSKPMIVSSANNQCIEAVITKIIDTEAEINETVDKYVSCKRSIVRIIDELEDPLHQQILTYRYIIGLSEDDTAERMGYETRHQRRIHRSAMIQFGRLVAKNEDVLLCPVLVRYTGSMDRW